MKTFPFTPMRIHQIALELGDVLLGVGAGLGGYRLHLFGLGFAPSIRTARKGMPFSGGS
jgi:hypothetical protein